MAKLNIVNKKKKEVILKGFWSYPATVCRFRDLSNPFESFHDGDTGYPRDGDVLYIEDENNPGEYIINSNTVISVAASAYDELTYITSDNNGICKLTKRSECD